MGSNFACWIPVKTAACILFCTLTLPTNKHTMCTLGNCNKLKQKVAFFS